MRRSVMRRLAIGLGGFVALLAATHTAAWFVGEARLEREMRGWIAARQAEGWTIATGTLAREGWPWALRLRIPELHLSTPALGGVRIDSQSAEIGVALHTPTVALVQLTGPQRVGIGIFPDINVLAKRLEIRVPIPAQGPVTTADLVADGIHADIPNRGALDAGHVALHVVAPGLDGTAPGGRIEVLELAVPPNPADALGHNVARLVIDATFPGRLMRLPVSAAGLAAWRESGGAVTLREMALDWGPLSLRGSGSMTLDERLQPTGLAQARLSGENEALDVLTRANVVTSRAAMTARAILALLARPQKDGPPVVEVPIALVDRVVQIGRIPVARLPEMAWPAGS